MNVDFSGYLEVFYGYDFDQPATSNRTDWLYNYNRFNEFNVNIGVLRSTMSYKNMYTKIALQAGTYVDDNYTAESLKLFHEAYLGVYLDQDKKHIVEAGILPSYIGFETASSFSNLTLSRSVMAENTPYYFTGVKYNFKPSDKWNFALITTNGWQRIEKPIAKALPTFGSQIVYTPSDKLTLNWSTFIGEEPIDDVHLRTRYFSDLYADYKWNDKWRSILGFDFGCQKNSTTTDYDNWKSIAFITQYLVSEKWNVGFRGEYFDDKENVIVSAVEPFDVVGSSVNLDFIPNSKLKWRNEVRWLSSDSKIFLNDSNEYTNSIVLLTTTLAFEF